MKGKRNFFRLQKCTCFFRNLCYNAKGSIEEPLISGYGSVWLERTAGGREVASSNLVTPIFLLPRVNMLTRGLFVPRCSRAYPPALLAACQKRSCRKRQLLFVFFLYESAFMPQLPLLPERLQPQPRLPALLQPVLRQLLLQLQAALQQPELHSCPQAPSCSG